MQQNALPALPSPAAELSAWEGYLRAQLSRRSQCRVRTTRLEYSPQGREQQFLRRLADAARIGFFRTALAGVVPGLQRQALQLIQLRRQLIPDEAASWQQAEVFLAVGELHRAIHTLLEEIDLYLRHYALVKPLAEQWAEFGQRAIEGRLHHTPDMDDFLREFQHHAADGSLSPRHWVELCHAYAREESQPSQLMRQFAQAGALQSAYLLARMLRHDHWLLDVPALLCAACFKDLSWFVPQASEKMLTRGHHAEWSAALMCQCPELGVAVPRLIRQHHECLDGSGLPLGLTGVNLRRDARILSVVTRWSELYCHHNASESISRFQRPLAYQQAVDALIPECLQGRWEVAGLTALLQQLELPQPESLPSASPEHLRQANTHWKIPRPHFLDKAKVPVPVLRKPRPSQN